MSRTREEILNAIEHNAKRAEEYTEQSEMLTKWAEIRAERANEAKQELKQFDEANK